MINFFRKYQSLKRFDRKETEGIENGLCYVFPKLDGTNAQTFFDGNEIRCGSRNRELGITKETDNAGFCKQMKDDKNILAFHKKYPNLRLVGEFLVPHTVQGYNDDAWKQFYIFDVVLENNGKTYNESDFRYLKYEKYKPLLEEFNLNYIEPIMIKHNLNEEDINRCLKENKFLLKENEIGEGIVIKNYDFKNKFGNIVWAKVIDKEFINNKKDKSKVNIEIKKDIDLEKEIIEKYVTESLVEKEYSKIINEIGSWERKLIPRLLNVIYYCVITEEMWDIIKEYKNPVIDFKKLRRFSDDKTKDIMKIISLL